MGRDVDGKHFSFWHLISTGNDEENRTPDLRRCERISWIGWIISNIDTDPEITWWQNARGRNTHIVILHELEAYAVILAERNNYYMLKTAYTVTPRRVANLIRERDQANR